MLTLPKPYQDHIVFVPFNEPEGNMFGTGEWSYDGDQLAQRPDGLLPAWDGVYALIKGKMPSARIAGPNTSMLYAQVQGFLAHTVAGRHRARRHDLARAEPPRAQVRTSVSDATARWRRRALRRHARTRASNLPININEYAFNYHTSVPGQMIQWISAIEDSKVDADIAYWNIDGNLSDSAVQANRGNGQWWLFNAYGSMSRPHRRR